LTVIFERDGGKRKRDAAAVDFSRGAFETQGLWPPPPP
jgi:hypothetical protein